MRWVICLCRIPLWQSAVHPSLTIAAIWRHWRVQRHFAKQPDPSARSEISYKLEDIVMITLCPMVSGFEGSVAIEDFGNEHEPWLRTCSGNISDKANGVAGLWLIPMARLLGHGMEETHVQQMRCIGQCTYNFSSSCTDECYSPFLSRPHSPVPMSALFHPAIEQANNPPIYFRRRPSSPGGDFALFYRQGSIGLPFSRGSLTSRTPLCHSKLVAESSCKYSPLN